MKISIIAFTENGMKISEKILNSFEKNYENNSNSFENETNSKKNTQTYENENPNDNKNQYTIDIRRCKKGGLSEWTEEHFNKSDALIFIGAIGIATRAIAPHIKTKTSDPAVIVVDELGQFSVPILSGHIGGANELAIKISEILDAIPVISTATDINNVFAIDTWAKSQNLNILNPENIKLVSSKLLKGKKVYIQSKYPIKGDLPKNIQIDIDENLENKEKKAYDVIINHNDFNENYKKKDNILYLIPQIISLGIGCRKDIGFKHIEEGILSAMKKENCHILSLKNIASIDKKANEKGIIEFCQEYGLEFNTYSAEELNKLKGDFSKSEFVKSIVNVDNVCERSAMMGNNKRLISKKEAYDGVTLALALNKTELNW
ncbi:cobalt-precorrin 5A hydrolase [uncultured Methanobrevibacter sp.]|uniref:cobalt-precorrin 5A hydrolase n=1 Tax=uncultured Methanobrevibacter sp. TaxID=253161 RepID=UPI00261B67B8